MSRRHRICRILLVAVSALAVGQGRIAVSADNTAAPAAESKTVFYRQLALKQAATIEDVIRVLVRFKDGPAILKPLEDELKYLKNHDIDFPEEIAGRRTETLTNGMAATMLMSALKIKGGIMYRLFPTNQRYAVREGVKLGIIKPDVFIGQTMNGNDLLGMFMKVKEVHKRQEGGKTPDDKKSDDKK